MAMVCPKCNNGYEQRWRCPNCGTQLTYQSSVPVRSGSNQADRIGQWQQTPWGRILVGIFLAQGLYYGFRQLCLAGFLATTGDNAHTVWSTLYGTVLLQGLQILGVMVAGMLAGAGHRQGVVFGAVLGVWNGIVSILLPNASSVGLSTITLYGQPILQSAFGGLGGFIGSLIWKPLPALVLPVDTHLEASLRPSGCQRRPSFFTGPVAWGRVLAGVAVAIGGTIWANVILDLVLEASEGKLSIDTHLQSQLVTWEIAALAMLAGSVLAGATTVNSLKQGLCVGIGTATVLLGIRLATYPLAPQMLVLTIVCALAMGIVGGWFGGQLFPPVMSLVRRRGLGPASI